MLRFRCDDCGLLVSAISRYERTYVCDHCLSIVNNYFKHVLFEKIEALRRKSRGLSTLQAGEDEYTILTPDSRI